MSKTSEYLQQLQILTRDHGIAVQEARSYTDDHLTADGLHARRAELVRTAGDAFRGKLAAVRSAMQSETQSLRTGALRAIPKAEGSTRDNWERVRMLLDAGQPLSQVIAKADAGSLHAIREWGPTWIDAQTKGNTTDLAPFERSINKRWIEIAPDPDPIKEYLESASDVATFDHMADTLATRLDGRGYGTNNLVEAFAATYAGQVANFDLNTLEDATPAPQRD
jgi:hypothetical protein